MNCREEGESNLQRHKHDQEEEDDIESLLDDEHDPVDQSEDAHGIDEVPHVKQNDETVLLVLLQVHISILHYVNVLLALNAIIIVVEDSIYIVIIGHLGHVKLQTEEEKNDEISHDRAVGTVALQLSFVYIPL